MNATHTATVWLEELYAKLRAAEARAADTQLTIVERRSATQTVKYIARQIERYEEQQRKQTN